jgi:uncharacterized protein (DUF1697 family)
MAELKALCEKLGWSDVHSYIQSGNLVFRSPDEPWRLESELESALKKQFGFEVPVIVRPAIRWRQLLEGNPFGEASDKEPQLVMLGLAKAAPAAGAASALQERATSDERVRMVDNALWIHFPRGSGRSKITPALLDRLAGSPVTLRNWRTAMKLRELAREIALT